MKDQKLQKTNVYRLLDQAGAVYTQHYYGDTEAALEVCIFAVCGFASRWLYLGVHIHQQSRAVRYPLPIGSRAS